MTLVDRVVWFLEGRGYAGLRRELGELEMKLQDQGRMEEADIIGAILGCPCNHDGMVFPLRCPLHGTAWAAGHDAGEGREGWD